MSCRECTYFTRKTKCSENGIEFYHFCEYTGFTINNPDVEDCKKDGKSHFSGCCKSCEYYWEDRKACLTNSGKCPYKAKTSATDDTKNSEGYPDQTACAAIHNIEQAEDRKFRPFLKEGNAMTEKYIIEFDSAGRLTKAKIEREHAPGVTSLANIMVGKSATFLREYMLSSSTPEEAAKAVIEAAEKNKE